MTTEIERVRQEIADLGAQIPHIFARRENITRQLYDSIGDAEWNGISAATRDLLVEIHKCHQELKEIKQARELKKSLRDDLAGISKLSNHYAHNVVIGQETDDNGEPTSNYLYCEDCDSDLIIEEVTT